MRLWKCSWWARCCAVWAHDPLAPLLHFDSGKELSCCGFLPCRSELSRWWISEARSSHVKARCEHFPSSVCGSSVRQAALLTWQVEVVWDWSAAWCWGGEEPQQLPEQPLLLGRGRSSLGSSLWLSTSAPTPCTNAAPLPQYCTGCSWWAKLSE